MRRRNWAERKDNDKRHGGETYKEGYGEKRWYKARRGEGKTSSGLRQQETKMPSLQGRRSQQLLRESALVRTVSLSSR